MRKFIACLFAFAATLVAFAQPKPEDSAATRSKFYFSAANFNDSNAMVRAMPVLARQIMNGFSEKEKKDFKKLVNYYFLTGDYKNVIAAVDSLQKSEDGYLETIELKSYAIAKMKDKTEGKVFEQAFKQDFSAAFDKLSFRKKVYMSGLDSSVLENFKTDYRDLVQKLKNNNADSLTVEDARSLSVRFLRYSIYDRLFPLMSPTLNDPRYVNMYPVFKDPKWAGVVPVQGIEDAPDPTMRYKLLMELTAFKMKEQEDSVAKKEINGGLGEVARKINLHVAAGVQKQNIDLVVVVHAGALYAFLNNEKYKKKYGVDNPNISLIKQMQDFGAKIIVCGQAMTFLKIEHEDLVPGIKEALTAQTVLSTYQLKGYTYYDVRLD